MKIVKDSSENEMLLCFLKGELSSKRFHKQLEETLNKLNLNQDIILNGDINSVLENNQRKEIMKLFRGYPIEELFYNFPQNIEWKYVKFDADDFNKIYYIDYDYWNELSNNTSKPIEAAKTIRNGIEVFGISNKAFIEGKANIKDIRLKPIILLTCNEEKYLIIEGHSRMTVYGLNPSYFENTYGFVGFCSKEEMRKYDSRMI